MALGALLSVIVATAPVPAHAVEPVTRPAAPTRSSAPAGAPAAGGKTVPPAVESTDVDDEMLEFLGSVGDGEDGGEWLEFLSGTDIDKVAKRGAKPGSRK